MPNLWLLPNPWEYYYQHIHSLFILIDFGMYFLAGYNYNAYLVNQRSQILYCLMSLFRYHFISYTIRIMEMRCSWWWLTGQLLSLQKSQLCAGSNGMRQQIIIRTMEGLSTTTREDYREAYGYVIDDLWPLCIVICLQFWLCLSIIQSIMLRRYFMFQFSKQSYDSN